MDFTHEVRLSGGVLLSNARAVEAGWLTGWLNNSDDVMMVDSDLRHGLQS